MRNSWRIRTWPRPQRCRCASLPGPSALPKRPGAETRVACGPAPARTKRAATRNYPAAAGGARQDRRGAGRHARRARGTFSRAAVGSRATTGQLVWHCRARTAKAGFEPALPNSAAACGTWTCDWPRRATQLPPRAMCAVEHVCACAARRQVVALLSGTYIDFDASKCVPRADIRSICIAAKACTASQYSTADCAIPFSSCACIQAKVYCAARTPLHVNFAAAAPTIPVSRPNVAGLPLKTLDPPQRRHQHVWCRSA